ncbi:MAG: hypothetical protein PHE61_08600 [Candidatus Omnitrophica bacterium]|nr:hypothetical protein [Candidatus Omnitrophota bacterium]
MTPAIKFKYDAVNHIYRLRGDIIPSNTGILSAEGLFDYIGVPEASMEAARLFGSAVHKACELWDKSTLDESILSKPLVPYLDAWKKFVREMQPVVNTEWIERPICSYQHRFGTIPDRVWTINNKLTVLEIKSTSTMQKAVGIQLAGQAIAIKENLGPVKQRWAVQLKDNGTYQIYTYESRADETIFISCLNVWRWKRENL